MTTRSIQVISTVILVMFELSSMRAQNPYATFEFGNEWIQSNLPHYEFFIEEDGIYDLVLESSFLENDSPSNLKIFRLGLEVPTYVRLDEDGNHHLLFYAEKNRGELDQSLYQDGTQLNPNYSLFSDQAAYYLVANSQTDCNRLQTADNFTETAEPIEYIWLTESQVFSEFHFKPKVGENLDLEASNFDIGEGFGSELSNDHRFNVQTPNVSSVPQQAFLNIRFAGNVTDHDVDIFWNGKLIDNILVSGYGVVDKDYAIPTAELLQSNQLNIKANNGDLDKLTIASYSLRYPSKFDSVNKDMTFELEPSESVRSIAIDTSKVSVIIDRQNHIIYQSITDNQIHVQSAQKSIELVSATELTSISSDDLSLIQFTNYEVEDPSYVILSNEALRETSTTGQDELEAYAAYRSSKEGGGHRVLIVDINDLYRQFAFGQRAHPLSIKHFVQFVAEKWSSVEGLFVIGKGRDYDVIRSEEKKQDIIELVPSYGTPGSDNLLTSDYGSIAPLFPVGRLAAQTPDDVKLYLDKIKIHEQQDPTVIDPVWRKHILHLSGGSSDIVDAVAFFLKDLESIIEESTIGAQVETFSKTSAAPIQPAQTKDLLNRINDGVSLITFLGHSSPGTFDFSLEDPSEYENAGQLPVIISLGCHSGNIHSEGFGLSEQFVLEPQKGAIAFLASSSSNYLDVQYLTGRILYLLLGDNFYNESVGRALQEILILTDQLDSGSLSLNEQFTLHGDPLIQLSYADYPDLQIDEKSAFTEPAIVTPAIDSFLFAVDVVNAGKTLKDSVSVWLSYLNETDSVLQEVMLRIPVPSYATQLKHTFPSPGLNSVGENRIVIHVDPDNLVDEGSIYAEENNRFVNDAGIADYRFTVFDQVVRAVYPDDMSIVNKQTIRIKAATSNAFAAPDNYQLDIDTTALFNSPILQTQTITNASGLLEWEIDLPIDEAVYYWKVSKTAQSNTDTQVQSFLFASSIQDGWNQSHYYQYTEDFYDGLVLDDNRQLQFDTSGFYISIHNRIYNAAVPPGYQFNFENFAASVNPWLFLEAGIAVVVGDQVDGSALLNEGGGFGSVYDASESSRRVFGFKTETIEQRSILLEFLDQIPKGQYVFLFTVIQDETSNVYPDQWLSDQANLGTDIISYLESEGATQVRQLTEKGTLPYNFIYQKDMGVLAETIAEDINESVRTDVFIPRLSISGEMHTTRIGPAKQWAVASFDIQKEESDQLDFSVVGIEQDGSETELFSTDQSQINLADIDAGLYPFIKLIIRMEDSTNRTASQLNYLRVLYEGLPDLALDPSRFYEFSEDESGEVNLGIGITNSSDQPMASTEIIYSLSNTSGVYFQAAQDIPALDKDVGYEETLSFSANLVQANSILKLEINPGNLPQELHRFNNVAITEISDNVDVVAPLLDVSFDGVSIQDGDIVSPQPTIVFEVRDEGRANPISHIDQFEINIRMPDGRFFNVIESGEQLNLESSDNQLSSLLFYTPNFEDGDYQLTAKVFDAAANESSEYQVLFKVVTRKTISNLALYPNPMRDELNFEYFITGDVNFEIHVYNASGKLVKQFHDEHLSNGGGGMQRSATWDGTDDAGNLLPSGVYTYQIVYDENDPNYQDFVSTNSQTRTGQIIIIR